MNSKFFGELRDFLLDNENCSTDEMEQILEFVDQSREEVRTMLTIGIGYYIRGKMCDSIILWDDIDSFCEQINYENGEI